MAEGITIKKLAETVGVSAERLFAQLNEALAQQGEPTVEDAAQALTARQRQHLLDYLKQQKATPIKATTETAETTKAPLTLRRQTVKQAVKVNTTAGSKTVNVEVRKKRVVKKEEPVVVATPTEGEGAAPTSEGGDKEKGAPAPESKK